MINQFHLIILRDLQLSVERLSSMKKYVFGLGSAQVIIKWYTSGCVYNLKVGVLCDQHVLILSCDLMQVFVTAVVVGLITHFIAGQSVPASIVIGNGLALSSTAVVLQVLCLWCWYQLLTAWTGFKLWLW